MAAVTGVIPPKAEGRSDGLGGVAQGICTQLVSGGA